jgi:hypothetical protein
MKYKNFLIIFICFFPSVSFAAYYSYEFNSEQVWGGINNPITSLSFNNCTGTISGLTNGTPGSYSKCHYTITHYYDDDTTTTSELTVQFVASGQCENIISTGDCAPLPNPCEDLEGGNTGGFSLDGYFLISDSVCYNGCTVDNLGVRAYDSETNTTTFLDGIITDQQCESTDYPSSDPPDYCSARFQQCQQSCGGLTVIF